ncbi:protein-S-isoprenylcysteine O-methyltransferase Ste14 [Tepidamorphus gemmatus]|uniref:Protein-S-isoprenylcysteine O-methyltransferase Ste14 n=1 Tax=Tepidamorphus gemmatus TaxID=747076 RepID=A0A4R3M5Z8_9HYPH|nr:isoprenylcysteine carboxylmethyltransferase family protein [Tepidamorphus gemmatus]TCT08811.1 protein-S-isoprenylcysteine O-methyltransferase Ste14 [Tepidamorphus gemmatus]
MISEHITARLSGSWLQDVQRRRKWVLRALAVAAVVGFLFTDSMWRPGGFTHEAIEYFGIGLLLVCVLGRAWCTLYIGGRKKAELVQVGPYSVSRNPLYVFSIIGAAGVGAAAGSVISTLLLAVACYAVFAVVVSREEQFLSERFGRAYAEYCARVPRFWPRLSEWRDVATVEASPRLVLASVRDGALFFLAIPFVEAIEHLHMNGILPVQLLLP